MTQKKSKKQISHKPDFNLDQDPRRRRARRRLWNQYRRDYRGKNGGWPAFAKATGIDTLRLYNFVMHAEEPTRSDLRVVLGLSKYIRTTHTSCPRAPRPPEMKWWAGLPKEDRHKLIEQLFNNNNHKSKKED